MHLSSSRQRGTPFALVLGALAILSVVAVITAGTASARTVIDLQGSAESSIAGEWNRLSLDRSHPAPEHERLRCASVSVENRGKTWFCHYFKVPEAALNFYWNNTQGVFVGHDITGAWTCPAWSRPGVCGNVVQVVRGTTTYVQPGVSSGAIDEDLVVTRTGSRRELHLYWLGPVFECPWFNTFAEALTANPLPLPFNGTWAAQDCVAP